MWLVNILCRRTQSCGMVPPWLGELGDKWLKPGRVPISSPFQVLFEVRRRRKDEGQDTAEVILSLDTTTDVSSNQSLCVGSCPAPCEPAMFPARRLRGVCIHLVRAHTHSVAIHLHVAGLADRKREFFFPGCSCVAFSPPCWCIYFKWNVSVRVEILLNIELNNRAQCMDASRFPFLVNF